MAVVSLVIIGAGERGAGYARWARRHPDRAAVVGEYTRAVKAIVDSGQLGDIMSVQHLEPLGFWHQAHSYVRGNWRRADLAACMLLAKSCHDLDWLAYILGRVPLRVSSFGSLTHFTAANRPAGAAVATGNRELISSGPRESLASHLTVFAAERARPNGTVETVPPHSKEASP
jgi:hypothetical protein